MSECDVKPTTRWEQLSGGGSTDGISHWLIHHAALRAPKSLSLRLEEEWFGDLAVRPSAISRLRFAIGCCWATEVIANEHQPARVPVANYVTEAKLMIAYAQHNLGNFPRRSSTFLLVLTLHAVLLYGLMTTLSHIRGSVIPDPLQNQPLRDPPPRELPPPLPKAQLKDVTIPMPVPDFNVAREPDPSRDVTGSVPEPPTPPVPALPPRAVKQVQGGPGTGFPNPDDFYPTLARHMEEQGVATVRVCVDGKGRLTSDPTTLQGTGSPRLDEGALKLARAGSGHYRPTTEDGQPVNSCYPFRIRFQLKN